MNKYFISFINWWGISKRDFTLFNIQFEWKKNEYYICTIIVLDFQLRFGWDVDS